MSNLASGILDRCSTDKTFETFIQQTVVVCGARNRSIPRGLLNRPGNNGRFNKVKMTKKINILQMNRTIRLKVKQHTMLKTIFPLCSRRWRWWESSPAVVSSASSLSAISCHLQSADPQPTTDPALCGPCVSSIMRLCLVCKTIWKLC